MSKTFVSLGLAASVHILPAVAHGAGSVPMASTGGSFAATQTNFSTVTHASIAPQHHAMNRPATSTAAGAGHQTGASFFNTTHLSNFNQTHSVTNPTLSQVGPHTWAAPQAVQLVFGTNSASVVHGTSINLDLSSTQAALSAGAFLKGIDASVAIDVGGKTMTVTAKSQLTPAEYLAAMAVAAGQPQSLILDARGSAVGGSVVVNQRLGQTISSLVIPQGVTVTDYSRSGSVKISGDVSDSGNFYLASSASGTITLNAANVTVSSGGLITDTFTSVIGSGLVINASGAINNAGTIASAASLGLVSGTGSITNSGLVSAGTGSITLNAPASTDLNITASGGTFKALNGDINIRDTNYAGVAAVNLTGGNYLSDNLNINAGAGTVNGTVGQVSGNVNTTAAAAHLSADSTVLTLGKQSISGDPTFANTGGIDIAGPINVTGANLAIVAGGNVISTSANASITDNGGDVLIIAGGVVSGGTTGNGAITGNNPSGAATGNVTVSLTGGNGGNIDFTGGSGGKASTAALAIDTSNGSGNGGNVTLIALANSGNVSGGSVLFNQSQAAIDTIDTHGTATSSPATSGNLSIYAGSSSAVAIQLAQVNTGGVGTGGKVTLVAAQATTDDGKALTIDAGGNIISLNKIVAGTLTAGPITFSGIDTSALGQTGGNGGGVSIATGAGIFNGGTIVTSGATNMTGLGGDGGAINISTGNGLNVTDLTTSGGAGNNQIQIFPGMPNLTPQSNGGAVVLVNSNTSTINVGTIITTGGAGGFAALSSNGAGGNGGLVSIINTGGAISLSGSILTQGGDGSPYAGASAPGGGAGGSITVSTPLYIIQNPTSSINSSGGNVGAGNVPNIFSTSVYNTSGGAAGAITFVAGTGNIALATGAAVTALGGAAGAGGGTAGSGTTISIVTGGDISTGNISSLGNVNLISTAGSITVSNNNNPTVAAIDTTGGSGSNVGSVVISAGNTISLLNLDGSNNIILTGSALLAAGGNSGTTIDLNNGNIVTAGNTAAGEAFVLGITGSTTSNYTVNGGANPNGFLLNGIVTGSSITFANGVAPTNFVPGGYGTFGGSSSIPITLTSDNSNLAIPIVASGAINITGGGISSNVPFNLYSNNGITFQPDAGAGSSTPTSVIDASTNGVNLTTGKAVNIGEVASLGPVNIFSNATVFPLGPIVGSNVSINAPEFTELQSILNSSNVVISSSTITLTGNASQVGIEGSFYTGAAGSVLISNNSPSSNLSIFNVTADTPNLILQSPSITLGSPSVPIDIPPFVVLVQNIANNGNITMQSASNDLTLSLTADIVTNGGSTSFISNAASTSTLLVSGQTAFYGGGTIFFSSPQLAYNALFAAHDKSNIIIDSGSSQAIVPMTISTTGGALATNGGVILIRPTGDLTFATNNSATLELNAAGSNGDGLVNVQGLGNVTLSNGFDLITYSPIQFNMNANQTITLSGNSQINSFYSGNASFPDPLGGTFAYSILFQNLISNFNIAGTGTIEQSGTVPGNTVFNDFTDVGFADNTNLLFQNNTTDPNGNSGFVNFFTRQIQVNGTLTDSAPTAVATFHFTQGVNINSNLPSPGPGNFAFAIGDLASSASLSFHGPANVAIGFAGTTPPVSIPSVQQPLGNFNLGLGGPFTFYSEKDIAINTTGSATIFSGSSIQGDSGAISITTSSGSNAPIILAGDISTLFGTVTLHADGAAGIIAAGGIISVNSAALVTLSSDTGNIGGPNSPINLDVQNITATTGGNGSVYLNSTSSLNLVGNSIAGSTGTFSVAAPAITLAATDSVTAGAVSFQTANLSIDGTVTAQNASGNGFTVSSTTALAVAGAGTIITPGLVSLTANGDLAISLSPTVLNGVHNVILTATGGTLTLPTNVIDLAQDSSGNGGSITISAAKITATGATSAITIDADGTGTGNGGDISVALTATTPLVVGGAVGNIAASAKAGTGGGNGGTISIINAGNLTVDMTKVNISATVNGNGGSLALAAGNATVAGNLVVNGDIHADGVGTGSGGFIELESSSKTVMTIGAAKSANGTSGAITANGTTNGIVSIANLGIGGLTISRALTAFDQIELGSFTKVNTGITLNAAIGGTNTSEVALFAGGTGKITDGAKAPVVAALIIATSGSGAISLTDIVAQTGGTNVFGQTSGAVAITNTNANPLTVSNFSGAAVTIKSVDAIDISGSLTGSAVTIATTGKTGGSISIGGAVNSSGVVTLQTPGNVTISGSTSSAKNTVITASGAGSKLLITGTIAGQGKSTITISVPTSAAVNGFDASAGTITAGGAITLTATKTNMLLDIVSSLAAVKATAATGIQQTSGTIAGQTGVTFTTTSSTNGAGGITLDGVQTGSSTVPTSVGGAITVTAAGGAINVLENGSITAFSGKTTKAAIVLENKLIAGATPGSISIGDGAQITTSGALGGNIDIVMGPVPGSPKGNTLPNLPGVTFNPSKSPSSVIFLGTNGVNFDTANGANPVAVNVIGTGVKVIFNTGTLSQNAITIDGGQNGATTVIQADPPVLSNTGASGGVHMLTMGSLTTPAAGSFVAAVVPVATSTGAAPALNLTSSQINVGSTDTINAISSSRTLYGAASTLASSESDDVPLSYSVLPMTANEDIVAVCLNANNLGISDARAGATEYSLGGALTGEQTHTLRRGALVVAPDRDTTIDTAFGQVNVAAGAVALVVNMPHATAVYNLDDAKSGSVKMKVGAETITIAPGRHTTITSQLVADFHSANLARAFVYRNVSGKNLGANNLQAYSGEFSSVHAFAHVKQLRELFNSSNPRARKLAGHMLKTTAILNTLGRGGQYQSYVPAMLTQTAMIAH